MAPPGRVRTVSAKKKSIWGGRTAQGPLGMTIMIVPKLVPRYMYMTVIHSAFRKQGNMEKGWNKMMDTVKKIAIHQYVLYCKMSLYKVYFA